MYISYGRLLNKLFEHLKLPLTNVKPIVPKSRPFDATALKKMSIIQATKES